MPQAGLPIEGGRAPDAAVRRRVRVVGLLIGLAALALTALAGSSLRQPLFDAFQNVLPAPDVSRRVHVVVIDADSLREVGGWPWSRFYLARLTEQIASRGAVAIGVDVLLPDRDRADPAEFADLYPELPAAAAAQVRALPSMDAVFARVIGRAPVVLGVAGVQPGSFDFPARAAAAAPSTARFAGDRPRGLLDYPAVVANLPVLDGAAAGRGLINGERDPDGVVRGVPLVARAAGEPTPGFALELARVAEGADRIDLAAPGGRLERVCVNEHCVPATSDGQLLLRFGDGRHIRTTSAVDVLRQGAPADLFKGQIVNIGVTSAGAADVIATPRDEATAGVFAQAQAVDSILRGAGLWRPAWAPTLEWGLGLLAALAAWLATQRATMTAVAGGVAAAVVAAFGASALAFQHGLLLDPFPMVAAGLATALAMAALLFAEGRRREARLRATLDEERRRATIQQQVLINELNHRVKNTLATVQAIAVQTLRADRTPAEAREAFLARLMALSAAHNLLNARRWGGADLDDVVRTVVAPFDEPPGTRVVAGGPHVRMKASHALSLALALQELGSNAAKFGALSAPGGQVRISWAEAADGRVRFVWDEVGGPAVRSPIDGGFGARLIRQGLARELGGQVHMAPGAAGLSCEILFRPEPEEPETVAGPSAWSTADTPEALTSDG